MQAVNQFLPFVYSFSSHFFNRLLKQTMNEEKTVKEEAQTKGIVLPVGIAGTFCVVAAVLCVDFIEQTIRYIQEDASILTLVSKTLAAVGWGAIALYMAVKLCKHYSKNKK